MNKYARLSLIAAAAMTLAACGKQEQPAAGAASAPAAAAAGGDVTVKIGQVSPMSGPISHLGKDNEFGAKLAIEDLNAEGVEIGGKKVKFELVPKMTRAIRKSVPRLLSAWLMLALSALSVT
jgi:branched-chain amino acid transport system substrate-binding protein